MAKLLIVSTNLSEDPYPVYPLGANIVAAAVRQSGHDVALIDLLVDGETGLSAAITDFAPDYIAFSMRNVDNVNFNLPQSFMSQNQAVIEQIKHRIQVPIILGGSAYTIFPSLFLQFLGADYGIVGPGEISLPKLITRLEQGNLPENPIINGEVDYSGDNDYYLDREPRLTKYYLKNGGMLNIHTKRGCPHHCLYCSYPSLEGERYIFRDPEAVVAELAYLQAEHGADYIFFTDSVFNDSDNRYLLIMEEMARREIFIPWTCYLRPAKFHQDEVALMKRTGLQTVEWGTDCSSDRTLEGMGKNFTWDEVREANNLFARFEIPGLHFIIFGGPGETEATVREGLKNLAELDYSVVFGGTGIRVFPNTGIFEVAKRSGIFKDESELFDRGVFYHSPAIEVKWLQSYLAKEFRARKNWVFPWAGVAERNSFLHNSGFRGSLWELLLERKKA